MKAKDIATVMIMVWGGGTNANDLAVSPVPWDIRKPPAPCEGGTVELKTERGVGGKVNSQSGWWMMFVNNCGSAGALRW